MIINTKFEVNQEVCFVTRDYSNVKFCDYCKQRIELPNQYSVMVGRIRQIEVVAKSYQNISHTIKFEIETKGKYYYEIPEQNIFANYEEAEARMFELNHKAQHEV